MAEYGVTGRLVPEIQDLVYQKDPLVTPRL